MSPVREHEQEQAQLEARFVELYKQLNAEQRQAVETTEGPVMVLAGPGTGKTQLLAMRIAKILQETQMDPWNILCVTFTESGTVAMRERLHAIIGSAAYYVRIHTFHSFCNEVIQAHPEVFARAAQWQPLTEVERLRWIEELLQELPGTSALKPFGNPHVYVRDVVSALQKLKQEGVAPDQLAARVQEIRALAGVVQEAVAAFAALKPGARTEAACEALYAALLAAAPAGSAEAVQIEQQWRHYEEQAAAAENARAGSKVRTAYKSAVKRWFDQLVRVSPRQEELARVFTRYQERLEHDGRYDYEDMLMHVAAAWRADDALLATYQEQFQYIMVDEYQDTNGAQNEILRLLGSYDAQPNICVVGDDKQSIYRFQGASLANMLEFYERFKKHVTVISLRENYRSQPVVLKAAQAVIVHNEESVAAHIPEVTQALVPKSGRAAQALTRVSVPSEAAEDVWVARRIRELLDAGVPPREIAVLFRNHRDAASLWPVLRQHKIPARLEGGEDALADPVVQQLVSVLRYVAGPPAGGGGDELLARLLFYEWLGVAALDALKITAAARREPLTQLLADEQRLQAIGVEDAAAVRALVQRLAAWRQQTTTVTVWTLVHTVVAESGLLSSLAAQTERLGTLQKVSRVLEEARALARERPGLTLPDFLSALGTLELYGVTLAVHPWQVADEAVRLLTAHRAKGLEFDHVFIVRVNDKHWGNAPKPARLPLPAGIGQARAVPAAALIEDERRLFYVALTRARQSVVLTRAEHTATGRPCVPSLFWQEVPEELVRHEEHHETAVQEAERLEQSLAVIPPVIHSAALQAWLGKRLSTLRLSPTYLTDYLECPRLFYMRHVLRVPRPATSAQALGAALHGALEDWLRGQRTHEELLHHFQRRLKREALAPSEQRDALAVGELRLGAYYEQLGRDLPARSLGEYDFAPHGVHLDGIPLTGRVDRIDVLDEPEKLVRFVDYKSAKPERGRALLKAGGAYHQQLAFYGLLARLAPQFAYQVAQYEVHFLQPDRQGKFVRLPVPVTEAHIDEIADVTRAVWQEIQSLQFVTGTARPFCGVCEYCAGAAWREVRAVAGGASLPLQVQ